MKATNNKKGKRYIKPEINCYTYTIETPILAGGDSGGSGSGEEIVEPLPPSGGGLWHGELD